jgi:hypothetical protein
MPPPHEVTFAEIAHGFCTWCEGPSPGAEAEASASAAAWLAKLYAAAISLPKVGPKNEDELPSIPEEALAKARINLARFNGWYYREFFDPDPTLNEEPVMGDIGDDLLDTYKDIKAGCLLYERGETTEALWHWSFLHRIHWGRHAVGALLALHCSSISRQE